MVNCQIYLGLIGSKQVVKDFAATVNLSGAVVRELGKKIKDSKTPKQWQWRTARKATYTSYPEDSILPILREHEIILEEINRHRHEADVCITLICQYEEGEPPQSLSLSRETVEMLAKFGASLEIDTVLVMSPPEI